ncbi:peptidoglycan D,D-transpeptidase FtsI family protein [Pontiella sulfatireligans]|uniref:Peptidoglycan D,D-transpeptidase MrdA n=1 Tax=Pontiella sulfatireligans TaxID=2750658 RepID=A0A6C2UP43_9BACT|nr:penicillin-binding transpeptidase domain-containing protein [Pontiella sulfatireligans]VGO22070.1 Peptidoglycan D,D-transpeptidase MrdA [Pontiella sulfatireligans]
MAMKVRQKREQSLVVVLAVFAVMLLGMGVLLSELWSLQGPRQSGFEEVFLSQSVRRVRLPAVRGKIYDTNGECLADSVPNYCIAVFTEEMRAPRSATANALELIHEIWVRVGRKPDISYREVQNHFAMTPSEPLVAWKNLDQASIARWRARFEEWTAPPKGSFLRRKIPGLDLGKPVVNGSIVLQADELRRRGTSTAANTLELVYEISTRLGIPRQVSFQNIKDHIYARRPLPLLAWKNLDEETMASWADVCSNLAGTDIYCLPARNYPAGEALAHLVGFTLEAAAISEEQGERIHFDLRGIEGKKGLEGTYNDLLEGEPGFKLVQIDVAGFHHLDLQTRPPKPGGDLQLAIDANIQQFAVDALAMKQDGEDPNLPVRGACVVLDPNNGDVLAMASSPSFNPNSYMQSKAYRQALLKDPSSRTYHRAVFGQYPPGSTFKPIVTLGVLAASPGYAETNHICRGYLMVGKRKMRCWNHNGHGEINLQQALMHSCNVYMFKMALNTGFEPIHDMAQQFGLGQYVGLFPNLDEVPEQKDLQYGSLPAIALNDTDLCNMSIGQGAITASPLQMAMAVAAIANGGTLYRPRLVKKWRTAPDEEYSRNPTWAIRRIDVPVVALELVRSGMYDVVQHEQGSAKKARVPGIDIAGKTGSAQYRKKVDGEVVNSVHTWMISYAPFDFPRYAVAMLVEDGNSGGNTIGPRLSALYQNIFEYDGTLNKEKI